MVESSFKTELNDFEAMLNLGLSKQVSETNKKYAFDFFAEKPLDGEGPFKWEKGSDRPREEPICRLTPKKSISIDAFLNDKTTQAEIGRFSLLAGRRSIFSSAGTESTSCESRVENSISNIMPSNQSVISGQGFNSLVDLDMSANFDQRLSIGLNRKFERRSTYGGETILEDSRESCGSIQNRPSQIEGTINIPQSNSTTIKLASKTGSATTYGLSSPSREVLNSGRSRGSGQKRELIGRLETEKQ